MSTRRLNLLFLFAAMLAISLAILPAVAQEEQASAEASAAPAAEDQPIETPATDQPQAGNVLQHIPADCMGFYVAPNMQELLKAVENYAKDIGVGEELSGIAPQGLLEAAARSLQVSKGYNPNGGVALVTLDFEKAGIDIKQVMQGAGPQEPPFVILLAGDSAESVFPTKTVTTEDGKQQVILVDSPSDVMQLGDYLAISPYPNGLDLFKSEQSILDVLDPAKVKLIEESLFAQYWRMAPVVDMMEGLSAQMKAQQQMMAQQGWDPGPRMSLGITMVEAMREMATDIDDVVMGLRMVEGGMVAESLIDYKPESPAGKQLAAMKPADKLLSRVPDLPYVVAFGSTAPAEGDAEAITRSVELAENLLASMQLEMPADIKTDMIELSKSMAEQIKSMQFVGGGAPGEGVFGTALLLDVKNAQATRDLLAKESSLLTSLVAKTLAMKEEDLAGLEFKYTQAAETVGAMAVDTIEVTHPEMAEMEEWEKNEMQSVLGEQKIIFRVAPVDLTTVVVSFGGGSELLGQAVEAAQKGGPLTNNAHVQAALKNVPNELAVMVFSPQNLMQTVIDEAEAGGEEMPSVFADFEWSDQMPLAMGASADGSTARVAWFVPTPLVKDSVRLGQNWAEYQQQQWEQRYSEMNDAEEPAPAPPPANDAPPANDF
jgi:hypothetical protein